MLILRYRNDMFFLQNSFYYLTSTKLSLFLKVPFKKKILVDPTLRKVWSVKITYEVPNIYILLNT